MLLLGSVATLAAAGVDTHSAHSASCPQEENTTSGNIPLPDLAGSYQGFSGGLYADGRSARRDSHQNAGISIAENQVQPLDREGYPDPENGKIVMISVGMSNTNMIFSGSGGPDDKPHAFMTLAHQDPARNPQLIIVNGAQGGAAAEDWVDPSAPTWTVVDDRLRDKAVTPEQVQVAWVFQTTRGASGSFPERAMVRQEFFEDIARSLLDRYPNLQLAYYSSMHYSYTRVGKTPEPVPYEDGFAVRWMIDDQLSGDVDLNHDPTTGLVRAPWLSWGPYLWTDGLSARSDGLIWTFEDQGCGSHPQTSGVAKAAAQLYAFFRTDPTTIPWYLRSEVIGRPPENLALVAEPARGTAPLKVQFHATADDPDGDIVETMWTFGDGTFSYDEASDPNQLASVGKNPAPEKIFYIPGEYDAHVTVMDDEGNTVTGTVRVVVSGSSAQITEGQVDVDTIQQEPSKQSEMYSIQLAAKTSPSGAVSLSWLSNLERVQGFNIERQEEDQSSWLSIATVGAEATLFEDTQTESGIQYIYRVLASSSGAEPYVSNEVEVDTITISPPNSNFIPEEGPGEDEQTVDRRSQLPLVLFLVTGLLAALFLVATWWKAGKKQP